MKKTVVVVVIILYLVAGCRLPPGQANRPAEPVSVRIDCTLFYRPAPAESGQEEMVSLAANGDAESVTFEAIEFKAQYLDDPFEGRSLIVSTHTTAAGQQLTNQLYQLERAEPPRNQFLGGHGFTGLAYVYHPDLPAELQYFCQAN